MTTGKTIARKFIFQSNKKTASYLLQWFSNCGPQTGSCHISWKRVRTTNYSVPPLTFWISSPREFRGEAWQFVFTSPQGGSMHTKLRELSKASSWEWDRVDEIFKWEGQNMHGPKTGMKCKRSLPKFKRYCTTLWEPSINFPAPTSLSSKHWAFLPRLPGDLWNLSIP